MNSIPLCHVLQTSQDSKYAKLEMESLFTLVQSKSTASTQMWAHHTSTGMSFQGMVDNDRPYWFVIELQVVVVLLVSFHSRTILLRQTALGGMNDSSPSAGYEPNASNAVNEINALNAMNATNTTEVVNLTHGDVGSVSKDPYQARLPQNVVLRMPRRENMRQSSGVMVSPTPSSTREHMAQNAQQRLSSASGLPVQNGPAVEQVSAYWRDQSRQALQYQQENVASATHQYEAAENPTELPSTSNSSWIWGPSPTGFQRNGSVQIV